MENLLAYGKVACLEKLEKANDAQLWDVFLEGQASLFFESESIWIAKQAWWREAQKVLEIGSGNGSFLHKLSQGFPQKAFRGIEKSSSFVKKANAQHAAENLTFFNGDAEVYDAKLKKSSDVIIFRLALQHLNNPTKALKNAAEYLEPSGHIVIIDSYDKGYKSYPKIAAVDEAILLASEAQKRHGIGNRNVSFKLLQSINSEKTELCDLYEINFSNIDTKGDVICDIIRLEGSLARRRFFNHTLLLLALFQRTYHIPVNLEKAFGELQTYVCNKEAWSCPGMHFLSLKKK